MVGRLVKRMNCNAEAGAGTKWKTALRSLLTRPEASALLVLLLLGGFLTLSTDSFLTLDNLAWVAHSFSFMGIASMGMLIVIASGEIDLSVGSQMGLAAVVTAGGVFCRPGASGLVVFLATIGTGAVFGMVNGILVTKIKLNAFIVTVAMSYIGRGLAAGLSSVPFYKGFSRSLVQLGQSSIVGLPTSVWIMLMLTVAWTWVLTRTTYGRYLFAVGANESTARLSGVPVGSVRMSAFVLSGIMAALAGFLLVCRLGMGQASLGLGYEMEIIAGAAMGGVSITGGTGTVAGVLIGGAAMAILRNGLVLLKIGSLWQQLVIGVVVVLAVAANHLRMQSA